MPVVNGVAWAAWVAAVPAVEQGEQTGCFDAMNALGSQVIRRLNQRNCAR